MGHPWICRRWVESGLVRLARFRSTGHLIVDFQDDSLGAVFPMVSLVVTLHDGEGLHDVVHVVSLDAVEMEEGSIKLAAE